MMLRLLSLPALIVAVVATRPSPAADAPPPDSASGIEFFEAKIRPVLVDRCYGCHSDEAGLAEGGLRLDTRDAIRLGGKHGPAVVPGDVDASWLMKAASHADPDLRMPPKEERLPDAVLADLGRWIRMGAPDPRGDAAPDAPPGRLGDGEDHWAYRPPVRLALPDVSDESWPRRSLDAFILAKLDDHGLAPSPDAEPHALLRRLHFDLVGLPPSPPTIGAFLDRVEADGIDRALEAEVDRLLASPQFGERWGRHWLDVARFGESSGKEANISFPYAWRYRDYVIDCVNADMPLDRFLEEQIAGDLLPADGPEERARLLIATGFLAIGPKNLDEANDAQFLADVIDEQIDTVTRAVIGTTVACARCHDHKFDPISMADYYALAGIFASTETYFGTAISPANRRGGDPLPLPRLLAIPVLQPSISAQEVARLEAERDALNEEERRGREAVIAAALKGESTEGIFTLRDALRIFWRRGAIEGQLEKVDDEGHALPLAMGVLDRDEVADAPFLERGEVGRPGDPVPRGVPKAIPPSLPGPMPSDRSGRLELARWLTHRGHPLTSRVFANRVWHHLFGVGLVRTVDHFGVNGEPPSHPELLDHLALGFDEGGQSLKRLVREIVLSRTYRQASTFDEASFRVDPDNRLRWRASKRRLDAEAIRDAMLSASGELDLARPVGSLVGRAIIDRPISLIGLDETLPPDLDGSTHRSAYLPAIRDRLPDALDLFDAADPNFVTGARETTNVPIQALFLMNSPFVRDRAGALADRLRCEGPDADARIRLAFLLCFGRAPDAEEQRRIAAFLGDRAPDATAPPDPDAGRPALIDLCHALLATAEFRNLD